MRYGLPYMGSKSKFAERIVALLPRATHLFDVFAGGCSISHAALLSGKWQCVHFSDITDSVELFRDCIEDNIPDGSEWISREDFYARKDKDPYVRLLWSFGNNQRNYLYSREIEPYKKAVHEMIFAPTPNERRLAFRKVCDLIPSVLGDYTIGGGGTTIRLRSDGKMSEVVYRLQHTEPKLPYCNAREIKKLCNLQSAEAHQRICTVSNSIDCSQKNGEVLARIPFVVGSMK